MVRQHAILLYGIKYHKLEHNILLLLLSLLTSFFDLRLFLVLGRNDGESVLDRVVDEVLHLQLVLHDVLVLRQRPQLAHQLETVREMLGGGKVHRDGDHALDVSDLELKKSRVSSRLFMSRLGCSS